MDPARRLTTDPELFKLFDWLNLLVERRQKLLGDGVRNSDMPLPVVLCFLYVASHNPCHSTALQDELGMSAASVSRNTDWLCAKRTLKEKGLGLITKEADPFNARKKLLTLTKEGERLVHLYHQLHG